MGQNGASTPTTVRPQLSGLVNVGSGGGVGSAGQDSTPRLCGIPLKYVS